MDTRLKMPRYEYVFRLSPKATFGLNQPGFTVVPVGTEVVGPTIDAATGNILDAGTESVLRPHKEKVQAQIKTASASIGFWDDVLKLGLEAESEEVGVQRAIALLNALLPLLSFEWDHLVTAEFLQATDESGKRVKFLREKKLSLFAYDLAGVRSSVGRLPQEMAKIEDDQMLVRALGYFAKGLALEQTVVGPDVETVSPLRPLGGGSLLAPEAYLNYWKVLEILLGATPDSSGFRRRAEELRLTQELKRELPDLYRLRNAADVAHAERVEGGVGIQEIARVKVAGIQVLRTVLARSSGS